MATLIAVYNSEGCVGRCDAKCYNATSDHCECICGGMNHGVGAQKAMENTQELADQWIEEYSEKKGIEPVETEVLGSRQANGKPRQLSMLPLLGEAGA